MKLTFASTHTLLAVCVSSVALILSSAFCVADTPPPDIEAPMPANEETLKTDFQPPDGNILHRYRFVPPNALPGQRLPTVLMFPPDVFYLEYGDHGVPSERVATRDLQQAGFLVFQVDHRLAPPNKLPGQTSTGRAPQQTDDAERQILAALDDPQCNGSIYLVGGSAGGCLVLWCGLDSANSAVTGWNDTVRAKIKAVVSLSGVTDPSNWNHPGIPDPDYEDFKLRVDKYVGLTYPAYNYATLYAASPVSLITNGATSSPPVKLFASQYDTVSYVQEDEMYTALQGIGVSVTKTFFSGSSNHAYKNWHVINPDTGNYVSSDVIAFFQSHP
ncbi:MAG: alpha/beta hydrolase fold domain-containing protein [Verrucomicrobiota bacterium]|nr:alpha/beta hydrolase fold domain-containing protein [Verrucomicrobiota bacterium]